MSNVADSVTVDSRRTLVRQVAVIIALLVLVLIAQAWQAVAGMSTRALVNTRNNKERDNNGTNYSIRYNFK